MSDYIVQCISQDAMDDYGGLSILADGYPVSTTYISAWTGYLVNGVS